MKPEHMDKKIVKYFLLVAVLVLLVTRFDSLLEFIGRLCHIAVPLVMGAVMAYILNIIMRNLEKCYLEHFERHQIHHNMCSYVTSSPFFYNYFLDILSKT